MTDERLTRQLRAADVPEAPDPAFVDRLYGELAVELGFTERPAGPHRARPRPGIRTSRLLLAAALLLPLTVGLVLVGAALLRQPDDRLALVLDSGRLTVAITPDYPQVVMPGGAIEGFDVDVAREIAARLGLDAELVLGDGPAPIGAVRPWDLAITSTLLTERESDEVHLGEPVAWWPITFVVAADSPVSEIESVRGRVGVAPRSSADRWARGELESGAGDVPPPAGLSLVATESDLACLDLLVARELDACLTDALVPADLAARPQVRALEGSPLVDVRGFAWLRSGPNAATLVAEVRRIVGELREDGTLRELSLRRFGIDITAPPTS